MKADPNLPLLEEAAAKLKPFLEEIVFVGGVTLGLLITDAAGAAIRGTNDVDVVAEILTYPDYIVFSERLLQAGFTNDSGVEPLACRWRHGGLILDVLPGFVEGDAASQQRVPLIERRIEEISRLV